LRGFLVVLTAVLLSAHLVVAQTSEMSIEISENALAHFRITIENPPNLAELRSITNEMAIHHIYRQQLGNVFGDVENLELNIESNRFVIEFDSPIVKVENNGRIIDKRDFNDKLDTMSKLRISLPKDSTLKGSDTPPDTISENVLEWDNVDFIPQVRYKKHDTRLRRELTVVIIILLILVAVGYFRQKKRK
jgi:hypothetical protein